MKKNLMALMGSRNNADIPDNRFSTLSEATMTRPSSITSRTRVTTALLLAAGTGTRLQPLTLDAPKCLTEVGGIPILARLVEHLRTHGFKRLIVVIGHLGGHIQEFLEQHAAEIQVDYVVNPDYRTTNNIYSLWLGPAADSGAVFASGE